ncbi:MAG: aminotransferase class III-fold pyridoxal phosphate-dependent enzyme [Saprospiraceae bacterium]|nr:aminotransferase class III-fold pyridoxal phosphate-dependent enzyme [Saprospiraceae bacterium]
MSYITTFGGNPVCCASALAGLQYLLTSNLMENSKQNESIIRKNMTHSLIREIRGKGLFIALELDPRIRRNDFIQKRMKKLLLDGFLFEHNSLRIMPPLDISEADLNSGLQILLEILDWYKINLESRS